MKCQHTYTFASDNFFHSLQGKRGAIFQILDNDVFYDFNLKLFFRIHRGDVKEEKL